MHSILQTALIGLVLTFAGIALATQPDDGDRTPGSQASQIEPTELNAEELAKILGIETYTFQYTGGPLFCWLEVDENGKKYSVPTGGPPDAFSEAYHKVTSGRVLIWWRPEDFGFRSTGGSGLYQRLSPGEDDLWFGWKQRTFKLDTLDKPLTPKLGSEIVLLRYEVVESKERAKNPDKPGRILLVLKAKFVEKP